MFSSATDEWETPQATFDALREEFDLCVDVAATKLNRKCPDYFGPDNADPKLRDALMVDWSRYGSLSRCWMNPPYSRGLQGKFIAKAAAERERGVLTVALLPARTDTKAFHRYIYDTNTHNFGPYRWRTREGVQIRFLPGRLKFGGSKNSAPFPSMIVVFTP